LQPPYFPSQRIALAQDAKQAVFWHRKAAEQGYALGQLALGLSYYEGKGLVQDNTRYD